MKMLQLLLLFILSGQAFCFGPLPYSGPRSESGRPAPASSGGTTKYCQELSGFSTALRSSASDDERLTLQVKSLVQQEVAVVRNEFVALLKEVERKVTGIRSAVAPVTIQSTMETCVYESLGGTFVDNEKYHFSRIAMWMLNSFLEEDRKKLPIPSVDICKRFVQKARKKQVDSLPGWARTTLGAVIRASFGLTVFVENVDVDILRDWPPKRGPFAHNRGHVEAILPPPINNCNGNKLSNFTYPNFTDEDLYWNTWGPIFAKLPDDAGFLDLVPSTLDDAHKRFVLIEEVVNIVQDSIRARLGQDGVDDWQDRVGFVKRKLHACPQLRRE